MDTRRFNPGGPGGPGRPKPADTILGRYRCVRVRPVDDAQLWERLNPMNDLSDSLWFQGVNRPTAQEGDTGLVTYRVAPGYGMPFVEVDETPDPPCEMVPPPCYPDGDYDGFYSERAERQLPRFGLRDD